MMSSLTGVGLPAQSTGLGAAVATPNVGAGSPGQDEFGSLMRSMLHDTVSTIQGGETAAIAGMQGNMPLQQVVEAAVQAEQALHTAIAIRDKVVGAYVEISRMQI
jgi:flagellar hook-basal body complex protein FliE